MSLTKIRIYTNIGGQGKVVDRGGTRRSKKVQCTVADFWRTIINSIIFDTSMVIKNIDARRRVSVNAFTTSVWGCALTYLLIFQNYPPESDLKN